MIPDSTSAIPQCDWLHRENDFPWHLSQVIGEAYLLAIELRSPVSAVPIKEETLKALGRNQTMHKRVRIVSLYLRGDDELKAPIFFCALSKLPLMISPMMRCSSVQFAIVYDIDANAKYIPKGDRRLAWNAVAEQPS